MSRLLLKGEAGARRLPVARQRFLGAGGPGRSRTMVAMTSASRNAKIWKAKTAMKIRACRIPAC
jgi:hypothetical protein